MCIHHVDHLLPHTPALLQSVMQKIDLIDISSTATMPETSQEPSESDYTTQADSAQPEPVPESFTLCRSQHVCQPPDWCSPFIGKGYV